MPLCAKSSLQRSEKTFQLTRNGNLWTRSQADSALAQLLLPRASFTVHRLAQYVTILVRSYSYSYLAERWTTVWISELVKTHLMCF